MATGGFNEAPAFRRGNLAPALEYIGARLASIRPRLSAGEIAVPKPLPGEMTGFNEAPAFRRGNPGAAFEPFTVPTLQ